MMFLSITSQLVPTWGRYEFEHEADVSYQCISFDLCSKTVLIYDCYYR